MSDCDHTERSVGQILSSRCAVCSQLDPSLCINSQITSKSTSFRGNSKLDLNNHKNYYFPAKIQQDDVKGRFLVATRAIKKGELILQEKPLMTGPDPSISHDRMPLCLGCYKQVKSGYTCSVCQWPMCDSQCEKLVQHSEFECQILASRKVPAAKNPIHYFFVNVLRCLLLQKTSPSKWEKILQLEHHEKFRLKQTNRKRLLGFVFTCFQIVLKSPPSDGNLISQILGSIELNAHGFSEEEESTGSYRAGQFLFYYLSLLSHDCVPNATWVKINEAEPVGTFSAKLVAALPIKKGDVISINYTYPMKNTFDRRSYLKDGYFFTCNCTRCTDPTEFGTYFSALKCPKKKCFGYLLPVPNDIMSHKCNKCSLLKDWSYLARVEENILLQFSALQFDPSAQNLKKIEDFVEANEGKSVHPSNEVILDAKEEMITMMAKMPNRRGDFMLKQIGLCEDILEVMDKICPGLIFARGSMLECLFDAKIKLLLAVSLSSSDKNVLTNKMLNEIKSKKRGSNKIQGKDSFLLDVIDIGEEAKEIQVLNPTNEKKVAKIQAKLDWLTETYKILARYGTLDNPEHFSHAAISDVYKIIAEDPVETVESRQPRQRVVESTETSQPKFSPNKEPVSIAVVPNTQPQPAEDPNAQPSFIEKVRRINISEFFIAAVILFAVSYEIQSYSRSLFLI